MKGGTHTMLEIRHRSRAHTKHGDHVLPTHNVADLPEAQPIILRLGLAIGDINAKGITRSDTAAAVAAAVIARKAAR